MVKHLYLFIIIIGLCFVIEGVVIAAEEPMAESEAAVAEVQVVVDQPVDDMAVMEQLPAQGDIPMDPEVEMAFTYGAVVRLEGENVVIKEYDFEKDEEVEAIYVTNEQTELFNIENLASLVEGDELDVHYIVEGDKRIAKMVSKEEAEVAVDVEEDVSAALPAAPTETSVLETSTSEVSNP